MKKQLRTCALILFIAHPLLAQKPFSFFAIGDMPYHNPPDIEKFKKLTGAINAEEPAFTVHVGDIKNGGSECSDAYFSMMLNLLNQFEAPLIYTPGDNEWTDCGRLLAGGYDPRERLIALRNLYFRNNRSLGQKPLTFCSQQDMPGFEDFVENAMWRRKKITFATVHVVGSNNNLKKDGDDNEEFVNRDKANVRWLTEVFKTANDNGDAAIVLVMHAALDYKTAEGNGFVSIVEKLRNEVQAFRKPVLLVYGDHHRFEITKPLRDKENNLIQNFTALMVYGDHEMNAVKISVDVRSKEVFSFSEFLIEY